MHRKRVIIGVLCRLIGMIPVFSVTAYAGAESCVVYEGRLNSLFLPQRTGI